MTAEALENIDGSRLPLIIPVEEQVRELNAKLLLSCVAAERGFPVILGSRAHIHRRAAFLPRGIYLAKSMRSISLRMFRIFRQLGHDIVACDEEALVPYPPEYYYRRRMSAAALREVSLLLAWGRKDAQLFRDFAHYDGTPIHCTGNPRADLMREELRPFFADQAASIRRRFGRFVLINTNFGILNHFFPGLNTLREVPEAPAPEEEKSYEAGLATHRFALFHHFEEIIPSLSAAFPERAIVVRPHPVENHEPWREAAARLPNVHVLHEGNVIPWLLASEVLVHNGCTTAVEAYLLGVPSVAYQPVTSDRFDAHLPNALSHPAFDIEELCGTVKRICAGELGVCDDAARRKLIREQIESLDGSLASDRIVDVLDEFEAESRRRSGRVSIRYLQGWLHANVRATQKLLNSHIPGHLNHASFQQHRFPGVSVEELQARIGRFGCILGRFDSVHAQLRSPHIFEIRG